MKPKGALNETKDLMKLAGDSGAIYDKNVKISVVGEPPNMDLYRFEGSFDING